MINYLLRRVVYGILIALHQYSGRGCAKNNGHGFL